jgi:hypothetical protein
MKGHGALHREAPLGSAPGNEEADAAAPYQLSGGLRHGPEVHVHPVAELIGDGA